MDKLICDYSQGICEDGAAILKDGEKMTIEEIVKELREGNRAKVALMPRFWTRDIHVAWSTSLPDLLASFEAIRKWVYNGD